MSYFRIILSAQTTIHRLQYHTYFLSPNVFEQHLAARHQYPFMDSGIHNIKKKKCIAYIGGRLTAVTLSPTI